MDQMCKYVTGKTFICKYKKLRSPLYLYTALEHYFFIDCNELHLSGVIIKKNLLVRIYVWFGESGF